jgi:uncharacterized membrane protein HdeD (DUF308 family)
MILGILLLIRPGMTAVIGVQFLGLFWLISSIFKIVSIFFDRELWALKLVVGILGIIAAIIVIEHPLWSTAVAGTSLIVFLGFVGLIFGGLGLYRAVKGEGWARGILGAVIALMGIALLSNAWALTFRLPWALGLIAFVGGFVVMASALFQPFEQK